ncbi:MAG: hypothetical protein JEZ05_01380 [Tenericutes bacterium]|nr:hypothetical protein [Mycoplasmatota bacterium]
MNKIEPYSAITYTMDLSKNILELREKIAIDEKVLAGLKKDNISEKEYYSNIYIHYQNKHLYYVLILRHEFGKNLFGNIFSKSYYDVLSQKGWIMFRQDFRVSGYSNKDSEQLYVDFFHEYFHTYFPSSISFDSKIANAYYQQCRVAYVNDAYYICAQGLFPVIEYLHKLVGKFDGESIFRIKENFDKTKEQVESISQPFKTNIDFFVRMIDNVNLLIKEHIFSKSIEKDEEPSIINRNRVSHGIFTREINKKDCLQLFCIVMALKSLSDIIETDNRRKQILNEIKEIAKIIKELNIKQ